MQQKLIKWAVLAGAIALTLFYIWALRSEIKGLKADLVIERANVATLTTANTKMSNAITAQNDSIDRLNEAGQVLLTKLSAAETDLAAARSKSQTKVVQWLTADTGKTCASAVLWANNAAQELSQW